LFYIYSCFRLYHFIDWKTIKKNNPLKHKKSKEYFIYHRRNTYGLKLLKVIIQKLFQHYLQRIYTTLFSNYLTVSEPPKQASPISEFMGIMVNFTMVRWEYGLMKNLKQTSFIAYMGLAYNILTPAKSISKASYSVKRNAAAERVLEILDQQNQYIKTRCHQKNPFESAITIKNINFKYEEESVLKDFSLEVKKAKRLH
jgi:subfamily B ATP-binding cassette protein MsbA